MVFVPPPLPPAAPHALDLVDEAAWRLRLAPLGTLGVYYAGSLPFVLALFYFCHDVTRNANAVRHDPLAALGMTVLFLGMKTAQAVFAGRMRTQFARRDEAPWTLGRVGRTALVQTLLQPSGLFLLSAPSFVPMLLAGERASLGAQLFAATVGLLMTLPLGWVYAFYANVTVLGDGHGASAGEVFVRAARHTRRDARGNHLVLFVVSLLGVFAWLNLVLATLLVPWLLKMCTGEENAVTRSGLHVFNATFFAVTFALVYLALDPLLKTVYVLRCFHAMPDPEPGLAPA